MIVYIPMGDPNPIRKRENNLKNAPWSPNLRIDPGSVSFRESTEIRNQSKYSPRTTSLAIRIGVAEGGEGEDGPV